MERIRKLIEDLGREWPKWKEHFLDDDFSYAGAEDETNYMKRDLNALFVEILELQKNMIDEGKWEAKEDDFWKELNRYVESETVVDRIKNMNQGIVEIYYNTKILRSMGEKVIDLIIEVFDSVSVFFSPEFLQKSEKYGVENPEEFARAIMQLDRIVTVHVSSHYDKKTAQREFMKVTGIGGVYASVYGEMYEKNMEKLQHNICMDRLDELNMRIKELSERVLQMQMMLKG